MRRARQLKGDSKAAVYVRNEGALLPLRCKKQDSGFLSALTKTMGKG
jgi:hypothetical protein